MFSKRAISTGWIYSCRSIQVGNFSEGAKCIHLSNRIIVEEDSVKVTL